MGFKLSLSPIFFFFCFFFLHCFPLFFMLLSVVLLSSSRFSVPFALLHSLHVVSFTLRVLCVGEFSSLHYSVLLLALLGFPFHADRFSSSHCSAFFFTLLGFPLCVALLSSLHCSTLLFILSSSYCSAFFCATIFLFVLFSSSLRATFFFNCSLISSTRFFAFFLSFLRCYCWCVVIR